MCPDVPDRRNGVQRASRRSRVYSSRREKRTGLALPFYLVFVAFGREGVDVLMQ